MWSIRRTLVVIFLLVVSVPLVLFWAWPHSTAMGNQLEQAAEKHLLLARNVGATLERYSGDLDATFGYLAEAMLDGREVPNPSGLLSSLRMRHMVLLERSSGRVLQGFGGSGPAPAGTYDRRRLEEIEAAAKGRAGAMTGALIGPDGMPGLYRIKARDGKLVLARIDTTFFQDLARSVSFGGMGHTVIVDHSGRVLAHPVAAWQRSARDISAIGPVARAINNHSGVTTFHSPAIHAEMVAGYTPVPGPGWGVLVPQPLSELTDVFGRIQTWSMTIFAMGLLAAALIALRFSLLVIEPLQSVIGGAKRMAGGEIGVVIATPGPFVPREFRELADTFNMMAGRITEARMNEAAARERAEQANQQKTDFVRYVTHELRSPVNAIIGFAKMERTRVGGLEGSRFDPTAGPGYTQQVEEAAGHLLSLINDLLDLGKVEAGHYTLREEILGLDEIVDRCFRMIGHAARERDIALTAVYDRGVPAIRVDERAIYQVILNLVTNAVRYGRKGGIVDLRSYRLPDGGVEICVCDDGPGIAAEDLDRVMQPFGRVERDGAEGVHGTGLGLPIVKKLVELHGGSFRLESAVGIGTVAYILLPASRCPVRGNRKVAA